MAQVEMQTVYFPSGGNQLAGHLFASGEPAPAIIVTGSWTTVKEQMADLYARKLAEAGFTTLTFDFAGFGESEGEPREFENPEAKIADITAAADWLGSRQDVAGCIGGLAICASAGYMAHAIAQGAKIAAFASVAAWLHDAGTVGQMYDGEQGVSKRIAAGEEARRRFDATGEVLYVPAYSADDPAAAMGEMVKSYYGDPQKGAVPEWTNRFAVMSWPGWLRFDGLASAAAIQVPVMMVHSEQAAFPENVRRFASKLGGEHEIVWSEGTQLDFYRSPAQVGPAIDRISAHFREHLKPTFRN